MNKELQDVTATIVDYGTFLPLAEKLAETYGTVNYYHPHESEYRELQNCAVGMGLSRVNWLDDYLTPENVDATDLWIFPDICFNGPQRYFKSLGKRVWGAMGAGDLELLRTKFIRTVESVGLPVVPCRMVQGLEALADMLKHMERKWVKISIWRGDSETFFHLDYDHTLPWIWKQQKKWGPFAELIWFVIQEEIVGCQEIGYDGWSIDGDYPGSAYAGYEKKNELYLGSRRDYERLPDPVKEVNAKFSPVLRQYGYCNFFATELRVKDGKPHFIDPTMRMAGQTMEQLLETCTNLPKVIYEGAAGKMVQPEWAADFAAEATMTYTTGEPDEWKIIRVPEGARQWTKLYHHCRTPKRPGEWFPPGRTKELGVILGLGDTVEASINAVDDHFKLFKEAGEPVSIPFDGFANLLATIHEAEKEGMEFSDGTVPEPESVVNAG